MAGPLVAAMATWVMVERTFTGSHPERLTALMISKRWVDAAVPMSLLADHPNVQFNYYRGGLGSCAVEMH